MTEDSRSFLSRRSMLTLGAGAAAALVASTGTAAAGQPSVPADAELARSLPGGFRSSYAQVNGVRLHYVAGGRGEPLILLPGWPETWWQYRRIMPALAKRYRVIAVDLRGMGGSSKPQGGYDKKTMARDIHELVRALGYRQAHIAGHDIGAMVAFSFAANHPEATKSLTLMDVSHPDESLYQIPMLAPPGQPVHVWWFAFNQVATLPEQLLTGRARFLVDWMFDHLLTDPASIGDRDRALYAAAYDRPDAIRAGNGWYQAFGQDIEDQKAYGKIAAPTLGLASDMNYDYFAAVLPSKAADVRVRRVAGSGHFVAEEQPQTIIDELQAFLG
ncbi:alpha/beta fold hydrolase [Amycolatopsis regifaucium]|uniref:Alpha/beta hydrolase n=1 Tax=Amycolatopsis regifaucium TaxID=546365 RepID=A0A154MRT5_9PSEU|nr:alpha/beta hydrolase [Amycolatopsis regifaucium]KZB86179.1 alpha/beta hydrolase [Amycolatopsis regifaucium]OKA05070.1 alpha/beta hydrolase [Amycolatopsis regifaucium]SFH80880.1 Pimeloyl-ACP methyl ester carboxylesterase [Amycolatopsis regifaucium]